MTLKPGDIIATGTPIKLGQKPDERKWLKAGDVFEMTVPEVGTLKNVVKDEKASHRHRPRRRGPAAMHRLSHSG